ncbi:hypothetical protein [Roseomonas sp. USHLN139]|uniref:hypothetical protein n=1 Tax=Roseomonas sp. USHLN139 TaxID=3081298 RepID=UPI003B02C7B2
MQSVGASRFALPSALANGFQATAGRPAVGERQAGEAAATGAAAPESSGMSSREVAGLLAAFKPVMAAGGSAIDPRFLEDIISQAAAMRAAGEDTVLVIVTTPGGGAAVSAMSAGGFASAVQQGGDSMGSIAGESGRRESVADHVRAALGGGETADGTGRGTEAAVAEALSASFATGVSIKGSSGQGHPAAGHAGQGHAGPVHAGQGAGGTPAATVEVVPLAARPGAAVPRGGSGLVNFVV